ncbi:hypothetical protein 3S11_11 [uncultured Caudovirales phage]|uniref:HeH/LEM domain-containing protein n=1 Tax=uncultured Caudovirales phage TaxID=2100421 RepID=A0A2H4J0Y2_9CAUD|nr:hypothetical protein [Pseudomonas luteola]ASN68632.1 hypothetical protein 3S11_11 [uncultured Caudovirales phage]QEU28911.1 hypothetical protein FOB45_14450 [Pseudomonas luteola]
MAIQKTDNVVDPNEKARWGFSAGADGQIQVGPETVGETGGVETIRSDVDDAEARNNGGGADEATGTAAASSDSLTKDQIKAQLDAKGIEYSATATKAELLQLLNQE